MFGQGFLDFVNNIKRNVKKKKQIRYEIRVGLGMTSSITIISFNKSSKYSKILKILYFPLNYSQNWLIPLVDNGQCGLYIPKLKEKTFFEAITMSFGLGNCANVRWRISWRNKHSNEIDETMQKMVPS